MQPQYNHLNEYADIVTEAKKQRPLFQAMTPGEATRQAIRNVLGFENLPEDPIDVRVEREWTRDGVEGQVLSWSTGFGPRTQAWLMRPAGEKGTLPGVLGLHDHGGFKFYGKEKIAIGPDGANTAMLGFYDLYYGGRAWVNELARRGFAVLVHDAFLWSSRKFTVETMLRSLGTVPVNGWTTTSISGMTQEMADYNNLAGSHEHIVEKYCNLLGTSMAGVVSRDDRVALNVLAGQPNVDSTRLGCMGLSGGGNRAAMVMASAETIKAGVIVGLMTTYEGLLDRNTAGHTWMLFPPQLSRIGDWPDLAASRAPAPIFVLYDEEDDLFTPEGMRAADLRLKEIYKGVGAEQGYRGKFYPGPHKFDLPMQEDAFAWLAEKL